MVQTIEYYFPSSDGIHQIHVRSWLPAGKVKAVLQIAHGVAEHAARYHDFAGFMAQQGFLVVANDHLGHGKSVRDESELCFFAEEKGWDYAVEDMERLRRDTADKYAGLKIFALGHSMGSFLLRTHLIKYPGCFRAAVLSGTGQLSPAMIKAGRLLGKREAKRLGLKGHSELIQKLAFGNYNKAFAPARTESDWLSRDESAVDLYLADPLCGAPFTAGLFLDLLQGVEFIGKNENLQKMDKEMPLLFLSGDRDPVGGAGKQVQALYEAFIAAGCKDVGIRLFPGGRHEMLNELNRDEAYAVILDFFNARLK